MATRTSVIGPISAYAIAVAKGYTGTEEEFAQEIANASTNAATAHAAADHCDDVLESIPQDYSMLSDEVEDIQSAVFNITETVIANSISLSSSNRDIQITSQIGDIVEVSVTPNGKNVTVALCIGTSFVDNPTQYTVVSSGSSAVSGLKFRVDREYKCLHLWTSSTSGTQAVVSAKLLHYESKIEAMQDSIDSINSEIYEQTVTTVFDNEAVAKGNTDKVIDVYPGDEITINTTNNGVTAAFVLCVGTSFVDDPTKYTYMHTNSSQDLTNFKFTSQGTYKCIHVWTSAAGMTATLTVKHLESKLDNIPVVDNTLTISGDAADAKVVGDAIGAIKNELYEAVTYSVANNRSLSSKNTDIVCDFQSGDVLKVTCNPNGQTLTLALCVGTSFVDNPSQYTVLYNSSTALSEREFVVTGTYKCLHIWHSTTTAITLTADRIRNQIVTVRLRNDVDAMLKTPGKYFACFGDSITSDQVTGIGTAVSGLLGCAMTGNFACGYAVGSDWHNGATVTTPISLTEPQNTNTADNVLSNQVLRCLQYTTAEGAQITWTHPIAGAQSISTSYGTGLGHTDEKPDILYIAIGINDGNNAQNTFTDDAETVMTQSYANLTKCSLASAIRWAIETLQSAYPDAQVFVASPLFTTSNDAANNGQKSRGAVLAKRECIKKIANYCNAVFIDSTYESGYTVTAANVVGDLHPNAKYKGIISRYVANEIHNRFT